jgi:hypothetical protein
LDHQQAFLLLHSDWFASFTHSLISKLAKIIYSRLTSHLTFPPSTIIMRTAEISILVAAIASCVVAAPATAAAAAIPATGSSAAGTLNSAFVSHGKKYVGTCSDQGTLSNAQTKAITTADFGGVEPENSMKWDATENVQGVFTFSGGDYLANYATQNGKILRCHNLLWHSQLPSWVSAITDPTKLTSVIQNHISHVAGHFAGKCYAWVSCSLFVPDFVRKLTRPRMSSTRSSPRTAR